MFFYRFQGIVSRVCNQEINLEWILYKCTNRGDHNNKKFSYKFVRLHSCKPISIIPSKNMKQVKARKEMGEM